MRQRRRRAARRAALTELEIAELRAVTLAAIARRMMMTIAKRVVARAEADIIAQFAIGLRVMMITTWRTVTQAATNTMVQFTDDGGKTAKLVVTRLWCIRTLWANLLRSTVVTEGSDEVPWTAESGSSMLIWYMSFGFCLMESCARSLASRSISTSATSSRCELILTDGFRPRCRPAESLLKNFLQTALSVQSLLSGVHRLCWCLSPKVVGG